MIEQLFDEDRYPANHYRHDETTAKLYLSCDYFCVGDYGGYGSIGEANIRSLENDEGAFVQHEAYSSKTLWLPDTPANRELIERLERNYPLIDEEMMSTVESEWEMEAWECWLRSDLLHEVGETHPALSEWASSLPDGDLFKFYHQSMDYTNTYTTVEHNTVRVDVDRIKYSFTSLLGVAVVRALFDANEASGADGRFAWSTNKTDRVIFADFVADNWQDDRAGPLADYLRDSWDETHTEE